MSLARHIVRPILAAVVVTAAALGMSACGRDEPDLSNGKAQFVQQCGSCHALSRAGTQGVQGPDLDRSFQAALGSGMDRDTVQGIVQDQIGHPRRSSIMPAELVTGEDARDVAAYVAFATGKTGQDEGALAQAGLAGAKSGEQIFTAAGCAGCHTFAPAGSNANIGPSLDELANAAGDREPGTTAEDYVRESLLDPGKVVVEGFGNVMPSFDGKLDDAQLKALVDYLLQQGGG